mgnify:CR=1 FL=1
MTLFVNDIELRNPQCTPVSNLCAIMKGMLSSLEIYLYRESVDFRKSINGLAAIIESDTDLPLVSGALFLFTKNSAIKSKCCAGVCHEQKVNTFWICISDERRPLEIYL